MAATWRLKDCARCAGDLFREGEGESFQCLQCGREAQGLPESAPVAPCTTPAPGGPTPPQRGRLESAFGVDARTRAARQEGKG